MIVLLPNRKPLPRAAVALALLVLGLGLGLGLGGCANMSDSMSSAFADPAKYDLYECKQLETERRTLATRSAELQGLMAKAETGVGGAVVSELAYRNEYIAARGQSRLADEAWQRNKSHEGAPAAAAPAPPFVPPANVRAARPSPRSGGAVY